LSFGEKLEKLRLKAGLNYVQLGKEIGMSADTISSYEKNCNQNISVQNIKKITDFFNVSIDYMLNDDNFDTIIEDSNTNCINDISDILVVLKELKYKSNNTEKIKFDNILINEKNKKMLIDGIDILINIMKENVR